MTLPDKIDLAIAKHFLRGERGHSAGGPPTNTGLKLSGSMPDRAGNMPALPK